MGRLLNECRWSSSRESTFCECKKKYWYSYYGAWEGWAKTPYDQRPSVSAVSQVLYSMKNMQTAAMFMGSVVHQAIEWALKSALGTKILPDQKRIEEKVRSLYTQGMHDSANGIWKTNPKKHAHILEHEYGYHFAEQDLLDKAVSAIDCWCRSACVKGVLHTQAFWRGIESAQTFSIGHGLEAIVVYDFLVTWKKSSGEECWIIFDWKTGGESQKIEDQLLAYAWSAMTLFGIPLSSIMVVPFYLTLGQYKKYGVDQEHCLDAAQLERTQTRIIQAAQQMALMHPQKTAEGIYGIPDPRQFPYCEDRRMCTRCPFYRMCQHMNFQEASLEDLESSIGGLHGT